DGVRRLLPRALRPRQAGSARAPACAPVPLAARGGGRGARRRRRLAARSSPLPERGRVIELEHLRKTFAVNVRRGRLRRERRIVEAVAGISVSIEAGALGGYLGPNG